MKFNALLSIAAVLSAAGAAQATLGPGSIAFTGFNADGLDDLSFVVLQDIPSGTVIGFTDNEWNGTGWVDNNENGFSWTASADITAGTIVHLNNVTNLTSGSPLASSNLGTLAAIPGAGTNRGIGNSDEAIFAFIGDYASPTAFLTVIANETLALLTTISLSGTGLTEGLDAFFFPGDEDIFEYVGLRDNQGAFADYRSQIYDAANWISQDASGDQSADGIAPDVPFNSTSFVIPTPGSVALLGLGGLVALRRRR